MEDIISRIVSELESDHNLQDLDSQHPISESALLDLQSLFGDVSIAADADDADRLWQEMASKNLPPSSINSPISAAMDSTSPSLSLLASDVYLSILLSPNSPLYTIFSPISFLSLLRSLRRSFKRSHSAPCYARETSALSKTNRKRKGPGGKNSRRPHNSEPDADVDGGGKVPQFHGRAVVAILEKLESVLERIHLDGFSDTLKSLVQTVTEIPILALESFENSANFNRLCNLCFRMLNRVLQPQHGDQTVTATEVLKSLTPSILLLKSQVRTFALRFVTQDMMTFAKGCNEVRKAIFYFPRFMACKAPEKSDPRAAAVDSIVEVVRAMEFEDQIAFADYVVKMTQGKAQLRLVAVDLILALLTTLPDPLGSNCENEIEDEGGNWWGRRCLEALIHRCSDVVGGIRARSLSNMAQVVGFLSRDASNHARLRELMGFGNAGDSGSGEGLKVLLMRCLDEKAAVKKAALLLTMKSMDLLDRNVDEVMLKTIANACSDPLVSIRRAALLALSEVFRKFPDSRVTTEWLHAVPPLIMDNETSIQVECENLFQELVLDQVSRNGCEDSCDNISGYDRKDVKWNFGGALELVIPKRVLILLKGICDGEVSPFVKKICASLGKKQQLKPSVAISLRNIIRTSESVWLSHSLPIEKWIAPRGAWFLLSEVSSFLPKVVGWKFLHHHWQLLDKAESEKELCSPLIQRDVAGVDAVEDNFISWAEDRVFLLQTISNVSVELPPDPAAELAHNLLKRIEEFNMHSTEVDAHVKTLRSICKRKALNAEEGDSLVLKWVSQLFTKALNIIDSYLLEVSESSKTNTFLTPSRGSSQKGKREAVVSELSFQAMTAVFTIGSLILVSPSADVKGIIPLLHTIITSGSSKSKPKELASISVSFKQVAPSLYIQSWLTMGKICLADGKLAKRYIPLFVQELEKSNCAALRNNIIVVMADFCVRYTALVDCYIPRITNSLSDPCEVVRRQTFILLSRLLQRDYVKWRGILFLQFLLCLVDESEKIRQLADYLFANILKAKAPLLAYNSFIEAIFVLNDCHAHAGLHHESQSSQDGRHLSTLRGNDEQSRSKRMHIYASLLKQMAPEHLLATSAKLCAEILAAASDGLLNLNNITAQSVLQDALQILSCKEMRIQPNRGAAAGDATEMDEESGENNAALMAARGRVVTQVAKKNLVQNAIPIFIELKRLLESKNSPLTGCLMECLRVLLKDYKNEIDDILIADKQLQKELIYDMQKYEVAKNKTTVTEAIATIQRTAGYRSPPVCGAGSGPYRVGSGSNMHAKLTERLGRAENIASAMRDVTAAATVKSVLKEINRSTSTPPLHSMSMPKVKTSSCEVARGERPPEVLESLRRRQCFHSDEEN